MKPGASRGICCGELVPGKILHENVRLKRTGNEIDVSQLDPSRLCSQESKRTVSGPGQFLWKRCDIEIITIPVQHLLHEEIASLENVLVQPLPRVAEHGRDAHRFVHLGHVALLARRLRGIVAMQPLQVRHLLRQVADIFAAITSRGGVKLVAGTAQSGIADVIAASGLESSGRSIHDVLVSRSNVEWPVLGARIFRRGRFHYESPVEAVAGSKFFFADLMADRAGYAIFGGG